MKITDKQRRKYERDWHTYNLEMRRLSASTKTLDEYVIYRLGRLSMKKGFVKDPMKPSRYYRPSPKVESDVSMGSTRASPAKTYTGSYIKGIGTMHKSNLVPITSEEQAVDIAKMRRS